MTRSGDVTRAVDLPPEMQSISSLDAHEIDRDHVRVACTLSDPHCEVAQLALLRISMTTNAVEVEDTFDEVFVASRSCGARDILVGTGGIVRARTPSGWQVSRLDATFLLDAFSLDGTLDFVFGDCAEIFRFDGLSWTRDTVEGDDRIFAMHGTSSDSLYAVGRSGAVVMASGREWNGIAVPIETDLRCVRVDGDRVLVAGDCGVAGALVKRDFVPFETRIDRDVLSICSFRGDTYFSDSDFGIHRLVADAFEPVANLGYVYRLNAGHWLTATAGEYLFQFDGSTWRGIELSYRDGYRVEPFDTSFLR